MSTAGTHLDVTEQIILDHNNVRDLFERHKKGTDDNQKATIANTLIREMAIHGDAEEVSVYKDYSNLGLGATVAHNKQEHKEVKDAVYAPDRARMGRADYDEVLEKVDGLPLAHQGGGGAAAAASAPAHSGQAQPPGQRRASSYSSCFPFPPWRTPCADGVLDDAAGGWGEQKVARAFLKARTMVPTRPHPSAPQTGGVAQKAAGMPAAFQDKIIETVGGREFVSLKHQHPETF